MQLAQCGGPIPVTSEPEGDPAPLGEVLGPLIETSTEGQLNGWSNRPICNWHLAVWLLYLL
jgi:hypothetical protein